MWRDNGQHQQQHPQHPQPSPGQLQTQYTQLAVDSHQSQPYTNRFNSYGHHHQPQPQAQQPPLAPPTSDTLSWNYNIQTNVAEWDNYPYVPDTTHSAWPPSESAFAAHDYLAPTSTSQYHPSQPLHPHHQQQPYTNATEPPSLAEWTWSFPPPIPPTTSTFIPPAPHRPFRFQTQSIQQPVVTAIPATTALTYSNHHLNPSFQQALIPTSTVTPQFPLHPTVSLLPEPDASRFRSAAPTVDAQPQHQSHPPSSRSTSSTTSHQNPSPPSTLTTTTLPTNPNSSPSESLLHLASRRAAFHQEQTPLPFNPTRSQAAPGSRVRPSRSKKARGVDNNNNNTSSTTSIGGGGGNNLLVLDCSCWTCGDPIAKLNLRGGVDWSHFKPPRAYYGCSNCVDLTLDGDDEDGPSGSNLKAPPGATTRGSAHDSFTYADTVSAAIDKLNGLDLGEGSKKDVGGEEERIPKALPMVERTLRKEDELVCDVCTRTVGSGSLRNELSDDLKYTIEVVCARCSVRYAACSDCGGGGGRLTPGRWRCVELFPNGRKTCKLPHVRAPPVEERSFRVISVQEVTAAELDVIVPNCRTLLFATRLGMIARPDMLEKGDALVRTYAQAERTTIDIWNLLEPLFRNDVEEEKGWRRYIGIQTANPRRARGKTSVLDSEDPNSVFTGFMVAEWDLSSGAIFYPAMTPWTTSGPAADSNLILGMHIGRRIRSDLALLNAKRALSDHEPYPNLTCNWIFTPFKKDSKMSQSVERRGYKYGEDLIAQGVVKAEWFPPHREINIPVAFIKGWQAWIRPFANDEDMGPPIRQAKPRVKKSPPAQRG
ncbi:hypothetical protein T439DRAFT_328989 [Meredithblackwellia eburnea MCA 4105]